jgi:hypothetical protein
MTDFGAFVLRTLRQPVRVLMCFMLTLSDRRRPVRGLIGPLTGGM